MSFPCPFIPYITPCPYIPTLTLTLQIFATVGSEEKVKYLMGTFGIPRDCIFDSHSNAFVSGIMAATSGKGVDVALNSLAGELLHATWQCVGAFGTMLGKPDLRRTVQDITDEPEIGKRDLYGHAKLDMMGFTENRSFVAVDARHMLAVRPTLVGDVMREVAQLVADGHIHPIRPIRTFAATEVADAFRYMQKGEHIGGITVRMSKPDVPKQVSCVSALPKLPVRTNASYVLVGGLNGIG